jgi:sialidase-1
MSKKLGGGLTISAALWTLVLGGATSAFAWEDAQRAEDPKDRENVAANGEGELRPFLGEPKMETQQLFDDERFPNVVVARDGAVLATWGSKRVRVRRSEDGGKTWAPEVFVGDGIHGGGAIVDEQRGDVLLFVHPEHPPRDGTTAPRTVYRSTDHGKTWQATEATFEEDARRFTPSLHMSEHGATLVHGEHAGRLIRPARVYQTDPSRYATAIYSDDGGRNWRAGGPLPIRGTGEGALVELSDGRLIYSARKSFFAEGESLRHERLFAFSDDGGETWRDAVFSPVVPDGPRYRGEERRGANYNGHFGMLAGFVRLPVEGRDILLYSNADHDGHERVRLSVWASFDGGKTWPVKRLVYEGPSAYSSLAAGRPGAPSEGWIYLQFEYGQDGRQYVGCRIARFNLAWLMAGEATGDGLLPEWLSAAEPRAGPTCCS